MEQPEGERLTWLGIDIGGTRIKAALMDGITQVSCATSQTYRRPDSAHLIECLCDVTSKLGVSGDAIAGVGLCMPGVRSPCSTYIEYAANVPGLMGIRFDVLLKSVGLEELPFVTTSDAAAASLDAIDQFKLTGRVVVLSIGAGVGMSVLNDGEPVTHTDGGAGHIGQIDVSLGLDAPVGPDGGRGSLEGYIGASALQERFGDAIQEPAMAFAQDPTPLFALSRAIRIIHAMYRPNAIALVGGLGCRLRDTQLAEMVQDRLSSLARPDAKFVYGLDDFHAARGAAKAASLGLQ